MNGQWIGTYSGTNTGTIVADFDDLKSTAVGLVTVYQNEVGLVRSVAHVEIPNDQRKFSVRVALQPQERGTGKFLTPDEIKAKLPDVVMPSYADTDWEIDGSSISVRWMTDVKTNGTATLAKSKAASPSVLAPNDEVQSWEDFKHYALSLEARRYIFRGHECNDWRLRTSFHRTGRASLFRFMTEDVPTLHRHLSGLTEHHFNLNDPLDYAAFLNLVQHHGYPTPILDWTHSPFVAAYFAYRDLKTDNLSPGKKVRILLLDAKSWNRSFEKALSPMPGYLHVTVLEPLATNNARLVPQQSISTVTNVDDLESYIGERGKERGHSYLSVIDLPAFERQAVMRELSMMGITAGSLFPGLDGACRELRERFFDFQ